MFVVNDKLSFKERILLKKLQNEYTEEIAKTILVPLLTQTSPVSLRALDWSVVNYSKQYTVFCPSLIPGQITNINQAYHTCLSYWKRKLFDPFRRRSRIILKVDDKEYKTTLGQANFALFTYKTGILAYVISHIDEIEADMNKVSKMNKKLRQTTGSHRKRTELTKSSEQICIAYHAPTTVSFD